MANHLVLFSLMFSLGIISNRIKATVRGDWERKYAAEQSWESQKFQDTKRFLEQEDNSNDQLFALREQPVKNIRVRRETTEDLASGSTPENCYKKIDLGFILDSSHSIGEGNFDTVKTFVKNLTENFKISQDYTRVSVISYAKTATLNFTFSQFWARQDLHSAIESIPFIGGNNSNIDQALVKASSDMFNASNGARLSDVKKVLIVITDGKSSGNVEQPAQDLKNIGVIIFSIGISSDIDQSKLKGMASSPVNKHVFSLSGFSELSTLEEKMASSACYGISHMVICRRDNITVVLGRTELLSLGLDNVTLHLADSSCETSHNETHVYITTALNECGTTYSETEGQMFYNNTLTGTVLTSSDSIISRGQSFAYSFRCAYDRVLSVTGLKFEPPKQTLEVEQSDIGNFTVNMGSYSDSGFLSSSSEQYPAFKSFSDRINIQYGIDTQNPDIVVRAESCRATPSIKPYDRPQYELISDGCDKDQTITHHTSGLQKSHRFSIQVFRFVANHTFVYIHCDLRLCNRNTPDSICAKSTSCSNRRKRRDAPFDATDRKYQLSIGPIMYREKEPEKEKEVHVQESSLNSTMIAILACAAVIVVLLSLTVVILARRRRRGNYRTSLEKIPMKCPAGKMEDFRLQERGNEVN